MKNAPRFSDRTLKFLTKASRQKRPDWLDRNRDEYEEVLLAPLKHLADHLKATLGPLAPGYHFPTKGIGRIKRSADRAKEDGKVFKNWVSWSAARPRESRFEHNPNLYFMIHPSDLDAQMLGAGGLYMPSSPQTRAIRESLARDASAFDKLFASKEFTRSFPEGFSDEYVSSRPTRGYAKDHPRMPWLRLQSFFVWRPYKPRDFKSAGFAELVERDMRQVLKFNALLDLAIKGRLPSSARPRKGKAPTVLERLDEFEAPKREMDF